MKKRSTTSVIIPVYNEEKYIASCLRSLVEQTRKPSEIIIINDGSTDNSKIKIQNAKIQFKIKNLTILSQTHQGPGTARNFGAKHAIGKILVFVDADMRYDKNYLKNLIASIIKGTAVATFTKDEYVANPKNIWSKCWQINSLLPPHLHIDPHMPDKATNFRAIRRDTFLKTRGYKNLGYGEDVSVLQQLPEVKAVRAQGAICYHYNPEGLAEVFRDARWFGRGETLTFSLARAIFYSPPLALLKGVLRAVLHRLPQFIFFKAVFDSGLFLGMIERKLGSNHYK